jgi:phosphoribosyl-ATP pyrophosphohydrolase/phosphoribosyl-AMP cyclohydrolase
MIDIERLDFVKGGGLVTVIAQDAASGSVLMVAFADRAAVERTVESGELHLFSRTRGPWKKGETSGNVLRVDALVPDCDGDAVVARVRPSGPVCHTGSRSCFGDDALLADTMAELDRLIAARARAPVGGSYTAELLANRNRRLKKLGEEAAELVAACADGNAKEAVDEAADLVYHALVAIRALGMGWDDVRAALTRRLRK